MKRTNQILWGIVLLGIGLVLALNALGITSIDLFFDGWWTLFIIVPCAVGLFSGKDATGNLIGMGIGVFLLLCCQDILDFDMLWKLALPVVIILLGLRMIFGTRTDRSSAEAIKRIHAQGIPVRYGTAVFSGEKMNLSGESFYGAEVNAVFGGVECDLRNAVIEHDCVIDATAIFGGVDIYVPSNINVKVSSVSIFGGVTNKVGNYQIPGAPTLYIKATCLFGGVDVK